MVHSFHLSRLMEEIEEIQQEHDREQFYHEQEQEMRIQEKEQEHERSREHNLELMHQVKKLNKSNIIIIRKYPMG